MDEKRLPFIEHLAELRARIIRALVAIVVCFLGAWFFHVQIFNWLMEPYEQAVLSLPDPFHQTVLSTIPQSGVSIEPRHVPLLRYKGLVEPFFVYLKASLLAGVFAAVPVIFWQIWAFIAPGLYPNERRLAAPFIVGTTVFFLLGSAFCRYVVMEPACKVLLSIGAQNTEPLIMMQDYFGLMSRFLLVFGVVFELPIIVMFLALLVLITHRTLIRHWRVAIVLTFVVGAMLTPPDPFTQIALALPLIVLYVISIGVAYVFTLRRQKSVAVAASDVPADS
jgi:sec-independent protein translocase protein TatC